MPRSPSSGSRPFRLLQAARRATFATKRRAASAVFVSASASAIVSALPGCGSERAPAPAAPPEPPARLGDAASEAAGGAASDASSTDAGAASGGAGDASALSGVAGSGGAAGSGGVIVCDELVSRLPQEESPRTYGFGGYLRRGHRVALSGGEICLEIVYPDGDSSHARVPCHTSEHIDGGWLRLIANTLVRLPRSHASLVQRVVIDNRPKEHGIAPFNRKDPANDARDGRTLWLHERLFEEPNHWAGGNHGRYWSYHVNVDGKLANDAGDSHTLFSPVLIHEIAHLVSYRASSEGSDREEVPACAAVCGGKSCKKVPRAEREAPCVSPYCMPFKNDVGTENFAEQYRFFFQSSTTRKLLEGKEGSCFTLIDGLVPREESKTPWKAGLPDIETFHKSTWASCGDAACKPY